MKEKVICIVGPTAVGKTKLSIELAKFLNTEIISGDSAQVYRGLDIGTAKIKPDEMEGIPHHLIDIRDIGDDFSVYDFQQLVRQKIKTLNAEGKIPIICGGTGLYIRAVLYDYQFVDQERSVDFEKQFDHLSNEALHQLLLEKDEEAARITHPNNRRRVIRALEMVKSGKKKSDRLLDETAEPLYNTLIIGLDLNRELLYERINQRVDDMMNEGLLQEVSWVHEQGDLPHIIGYKEFKPYFSGEISLEEVLELIKRNSRRLAKRQLTFFRNQLETKWFTVHLDHFEKTISSVMEKTEEWMNSFS